MNHIPNEYKIIGDTTIIYMTTYKKGTFETLVDTKDLDKVLKRHTYRWTPWYAKNTDSYYARSTVYQGIGVNPLTIYLHYYIMDCPDGYKVDHINHDTLDNRRENLRISLNDENTKHRKSKNSNNTSGYRNVSWNSRHNKWMVQLQIEGKNTVLKYFDYDKVDEAGVYAELMRQKYYGEFKGLS